MRNYKLYIIRHGRTAANEDGRYIGVTDEPLSSAGTDEIIHLTEQFEYPPVQKVYTSPLARCTETAALIYPDVFMEKIEEMREYDFGIFDGMPLEKLKNDPAFIQWAVNGVGKPPKGEERDAFTRRIITGIQKILQDMMHLQIFDAALITHGGVLMTVLSGLCLPKKQPLEWACDPGHGYTLVTSAQMWSRDGLFEVYTPLPFDESQVYGSPDYVTADWDNTGLEELEEEEDQ